MQKPDFLSTRHGSTAVSRLTGEWQGIPSLLLSSCRWGYLSRAGLNDKSQLCRQIEKYADVYTSRVSNFLRFTPYMYFRWVYLQ